MKSIRLALLIAVSAALVPLLAGCTPAAPSATQGSTSTAAAHNAADTAFAQMMVVHHEGAIEMSALAETKAGSAEVRSLATRIKAAQGPEIDQMRGWLQEWGEAAPEDSSMAGMGHEGMDMGGLDQHAAMDELGKLDGTAFDQRFLSLMIQHHQGALTMAQQQITQGRNQAAVALARTIVAAQEKEITEMQGLLDGLR
jgi:uncharacterized protein (DUF305 family)